MNRGNGGEDIFHTDVDRLSFLKALEDSCETYGIKLFAYVLMSNHFHMICQTEQANLSEFMRHFLVTYTVRFNRRWTRTGHVFQGRYKSLLVEQDQYLLPLSRYIHLNPLRTKELMDQDVEAKEKYLKNYVWSSLPGYCSTQKRATMPDYGWLLETYFCGDNSEGRKQYWTYVREGVTGKVESPFDDVVHQSILGTDTFVEWAKKKISWGADREVPSLRQLRRSQPVEKVLDVIAEACGIEVPGIFDRRSGARFVRQMAMELCYRYSPVTLRELGELFGVDYSTVSQNRRRFRTILESSTDSKREFDEVDEKIAAISKQKI